jgi:hypothetical protein
VLGEGHTIPCTWHGLAPLAVDREQDLGLYFEPNLWMVHAVE